MRYKVALTVVGLLLSAVCAGGAEHALTETDCVDRALAQNPEIKFARQVLNEARGLVMEAGSDSYPLLTTKFSYNRYDRGFDVPKELGSQFLPQESGQAELHLRQYIFRGAKIGAVKRAARYSKQIADLGWELAQISVAHHAAAAYFDTLLAAEVLKVQKYGFVLASRHYDEVKTLVEAGEAPRFDELRAKVRLGNVKADLIQAEEDYKSSVVALYEVMGETQQTSIDLERALFYRRKECDLNICLETAFRRRLEPQRDELYITAQKEYGRAIRSENWPELTLEGTATRERTNILEGGGTGLTLWDIGLSVSFPLFDGWRTKGRHLQQEAEILRAVHTAELTRLAIERQVRDAYLTLIQAREEVEARRLTVGEAEEGRRLAEVRYRAGAARELEVKDAQGELTQAKRDYAQAVHRHLIAVLDIERASGVFLDRYRKGDKGTYLGEEPDSTPLRNDVEDQAEQ